MLACDLCGTRSKRKFFGRTLIFFHSYGYGMAQSIFDNTLDRYLFLCFIFMLLLAKCLIFF